MVQLNKALEQLSEKELRDLIPQASKNVSYSYADIVGELERRRMKREACRSFVLSIVAVIVSALSLLASVLVAIYVNRSH